MSAIFLHITVISYFLAAGAFLIFFYYKSKRVGVAGTALVLVGFITHTAAMALRAQEVGHLPLTSLHEAMTFFSWTITLLFLLSRYKYRIEILGAFVVPLAFITLGYAAVLPSEVRPILPVLKSYWLAIHVTLAVLGNAAFAVTFVAGIMYLLQERQLKRKKPGAFYYRLPSLEVLDQLGYRALSFGFPFQTLGIITGSLWAAYAFGSYWRWDPKETFTLITWFIYAVLLHGRLVVGWRGRRAAFLCIVGFCTVMFTFVGLSLLTEGYHSFQ
ncbi:MAG: c-type cytochrome biogenesis protein CcsB [bacterium]|nr:c-type cytochrome biogenesis protein CcsB [bacterium]